MGADEEAPIAVKLHKPLMQPSCLAFNCCLCPCGAPELRVFPAEVEDPAEVWDKSALASVEFPQTVTMQCCGQIKQTVYVGDEEKYTISGSACCSIPPCCDLDLEIQDEDEEHVGSMTFHAQSCGECCKQTNRFEIHFPDDAGPTEKAALVGSAFLTDLMIEAQKKNNDNGGN